MKLIYDLISLQRIESLSDEKFGAKFGMSRITWIRIKTGKAKITLNFLRKVIEIYPGLRKEVEKILSINDTPCVKGR